jgi:hypothetical protein
VAYTVQDGVGAWSEDVSEVHAGYEVRVGQAASGTKKLSRKERRAAKALSAAAGSSSAVMFLDAAALPNRTNEVVNTLLSEHAAGDLHQSFEQREKPLLHFVPQQVQVEVDNYLEEERRCKFLEFSGLTEEAYVALNIRTEERNLKKRKQAGEAAKQAGKWN